MMGPKSVNTCMSRLLLSAEEPLMDEIFSWCRLNQVDMYYGRIWSDRSSPIGWQIVIANDPKVSFLLLKYSDSVSVLEL